MADRCPICGLPDSRHAQPEAPYCVISGGDRCYRRGFERLQAVVTENVATMRAQDELLGRARALLVDVTRKLDQALELLPKEARG